MKDFYVPEYALMDFEFYNERNVTMHYHQNTELLYVLEGTLTVLTDEDTQRLKEKDFLIVNANDRHALSADRPVFYVCLHMNYMQLSHYLDMAKIMFVCNSTQSRQPFHARIADALDTILSNYFSKSGVSLIALNSLYFSLLHEITDNCMAYIDDERFKTRKSVEQSRLNQITGYVCTNYRNEIRLNDLAGQLYLSPAYLSKYIKSHFQMNFVDYVNSVRLYYAVRDIRTTDHKITTIAVNNGFPNVAAFNHAFRKFFDTTPSEFRLAEKKKAAEKDAAADKSGITLQAENYLQSRLASAPRTHSKKQYLTADAYSQKIYHKYWKRMINIDRISDLFEADVQAHILVLKEQLGFEYMRFWDIYSDDLELHISGSGDYNFIKLDRIMDFLNRSHIYPYLDIGFKPDILVENLDQYIVSEKKEILFQTYPEAGRFFRAFIAHYANRYGIREVENWYFELWKDPRLIKGTDFSEYFAIFEVCYDALKAISPNIRVGGGSIHMSFDEFLFEDFLKEWKRRIIRPDFLTIYSYPYKTVEAGKAIDRRRSQDTAYLKASISAVTDVLNRTGFIVREVHVSEWSASVSNRNRMNDSVWQGAYIMKNIIDNIDSVSLLGYWLGSDLFSQHGNDHPILNGGVGLLTHTGIKKPAFYAFEFMNRMGKYLVARYENALITSNGHNSFYIAIHNMKEPNHNYYRVQESELDPAHPQRYFDDLTPLECNCQISHIKNGIYQIKIRRINASHGSVFDSWHEMGQFSSLTPEDLLYLDQISVPNIQLLENQVTDETLNFETVLEANEIQMIHVSYRYV